MIRPSDSFPIVMATIIVQRTIVEIDRLFDQWLIIGGSEVGVGVLFSVCSTVELLDSVQF